MLLRDYTRTFTVDVNADKKVTVHMSNVRIDAEADNTHYIAADFEIKYPEGDVADITFDCYLDIDYQKFIFGDEWKGQEESIRFRKNNAIDCTRRTNSWDVALGLYDYDEDIYWRPILTDELERAFWACEDRPECKEMVCYGYGDDNCERCKNYLKI